MGAEKLIRKTATLFLGLLLCGAASAGSWEADINKAARLHKKGDLKGAESVLLKTLLTAEQFGEGDERLAYTLDYLGTLNMQMGEADKAGPIFDRAVKAFGSAKGKGAEE